MLGFKPHRYPPAIIAHAVWLQAPHAPSARTPLCPTPLERGV
jgi:hypothetical protein